MPRACAFGLREVRGSGARLLPRAAASPKRRDTRMHQPGTPLRRLRRPAVAPWQWFVGCHLVWRGLACGRRWRCWSTQMVGERRRRGEGCAPVLWVARSLVDLGGCLRRKDLHRHIFRSAAPPRHTNCFAMFFCSCESQRSSASSTWRLKVRSARCPHRRPTRERAVDMTAQPGEGAASAQRRHHGRSRAAAVG
jgi:hypothetical protein